MFINALVYGWRFGYRVVIANTRGGQRTPILPAKSKCFLETLFYEEKHQLHTHERRHGVADEPQPSEGCLGLLLLDDLSGKPIDALGVPSPGTDTLGVDPGPGELLATLYTCTTTIGRTCEAVNVGFRRKRKGIRDAARVSTLLKSGDTQGAKSFWS